MPSVRRHPPQGILVSRPFVEREPSQLLWCSENQHHYWSDAPHDCSASRRVEAFWNAKRALTLATTLGAACWILIIVGIWRVAR